MRKLVLIKILLYFQIFASAQSTADTEKNFYYSLLPPEKATVYYKGDSSLIGMLSEISDTAVVLFSLEPKDNAYKRIVTIIDIKKIKVQRHGVMLGVTYGAGTGFILGGIAGAVIDANSPGPSDASAAFTVGGIMGAIPLGIIGGLGGGIFTKHTFRIKGNPEKLRKLEKILIRSQKVLSPNSR